MRTPSRTLPPPRPSLRLLIDALTERHRALSVPPVVAIGADAT